MSVRWQMISKKDETILSEGYETDLIVTGDCVPTDCYCILVNKFCYKLQLDITPTLDQSDQELGTTATLRVTLKNNALLNISQDIEVAVASFSGTNDALETKTEDNGLGTGVLIGIIAAVVVFVVLWLIIVALVMQRRNRRDPETFGDDIGHQNPCYTNEVTVNTYTAPHHPPPAYTPTSRPLPMTEKPKKKEIMEDEYASPFALTVSPGNITVSEIHPRDIHNEGVIVEGNHSQVYLGSVPSLGLTNVAVKTLKDDSKVGEKETLLHEIKMIRMLPNHENIVRLLGFTGIRDPVAMVMEFAPNADLSKYLQQSRDSLYDNRIDQLSSAQLCIYAQQVCSGMQHIQRHKIIHRNLGARNILVGDNKVCKITDFGRAVVADIDGTFVETQEIQLPVRWTAVEGLRDRLFSMNSDVWSFGVLMWEIVTLGSKPYGNMPIKKIAEDVIGGMRLTKPLHCSDALFTVMETCWRATPDRRPSFNSLYRDINGVIRSNQQTIDVSAFDGDEYMGLDDVRR
ncbi:tyrosine kinase receptor Cad96Ca-like isoform X2 [Anneissia japonica]|nr:tyrosine kinase receptor Cad96Ca-like isoform X2 [Anneissia japonica]